MSRQRLVANPAMLDELFLVAFVVIGQIVLYKKRFAAYRLPASLTDKAFRVPIPAQRGNQLALDPMSALMTFFAEPFFETMRVKGFSFMKVEGRFSKGPVTSGTDKTGLMPILVEGRDIDSINLAATPGTSGHIHLDLCFCIRATKLTFANALICVLENH